MESLPSYSIAIRTLGTSGERFRMELDSITVQSIQPEKVVVYIAEGYPRPAFTVGKEEYMWVKKGMISQRALSYNEIDSDCILMLDDDVSLAPDSAELMLKALNDNDADAIGADVFKNHKMDFSMKAYAVITNLVFPHRSRKWAFKIHMNGSFSYNNKPSESFYSSQSCGGPAIMWRKDALVRLHLEDELWLDSLGFAYGDDQLETYKLYCNGGLLGVIYDAGITNLDAQSSSAAFRKSSDHIYVRTKAQYMIWYRSIFRNGSDTAVSRLAAAIAFGLKALWLLFVMCGAAIIKLDGRFVSSYFKGLRDGMRAVRSPEFRSLPPYCFTER
jgi:GT2 family glycosyltransferase